MPTLTREQALLWVRGWLQIRSECSYLAIKVFVTEYQLNIAIKYDSPFVEYRTVNEAI